ncbi:MAG: hypothetical protein H5T78_22945, partial [Nocardia sp.]|nr:hypothetical protein [Nocardia sp.]
MTFVDHAYNNDGSELGRYLNAAAHLMLPGLVAVAAGKSLSYFGVRHMLVDLAIIVGSFV